MVDSDYSMTTVDLNNIGYRDEPFVLANDVTQFFLCEGHVYNTQEEKAQRSIHW